ncbi:hypothetical protein ACFQZV_11445 [Microbacterium koreense]|uniref:Uncharacterized protein n=1 Tax=Microbacterium koreense TaxID=323761 RepID=A0ABW2ZTG8_9MICO
MVFDPTFGKITEDADQLPDLDGADAEEGPLEMNDEADALPPVGED